MTYGIYLDGNINTRTGGNMVFFNKFAEGNHNASITFDLSISCHVLLTYGFTCHWSGEFVGMYLDGTAVAEHRPVGGSINQQSFKRWLNAGRHTVNIQNNSGHCSVFVQGVSDY